MSLPISKCDLHTEPVVGARRKAGIWGEKVVERRVEDGTSLKGRRWSWWGRRRRCQSDDTWPTGTRRVWCTCQLARRWTRRLSTRPPRQTLRQLPLCRRPPTYCRLHSHITTTCQCYCHAVSRYGLEETDVGRLKVCMVANDELTMSMSESDYKWSFIE